MRAAGPPAGLPIHYAALGFAVLALGLFGSFIFGSGRWMASNVIGDGTRYFIFMRGFYAEQLLAGNIPLWNPHTFSGLPFVGVFQSAVFYPLNLLYLIMDTARGLSVDFALHLTVLLTCTYAWLRGWGLRSTAAVFGALVLGLSAPNFLRILAGQLTVLNTLCWAPLLLLAVDRLRERHSAGWILCGSATTAAMLLAGHPPTVFMAGFFVGLYALLRLPGAVRPLRFVISLVAIAAVALALSAVQLLPGFEIAAEGIRSGGTDFAFATSFSFPPENLLTLVVPYAFGDAETGLIYERTWYGRWFYWDASIYLGVVTCVLAVAGIAQGRTELRRIALVLFPLSVVLGLGSYTPIYQLFFRIVPGFSLFRAPSKFVFFAAMFAAALAAIGVDRLQAREGSGHAALRFAGGVGVLLGISALALALAPVDGEGGGSFVRWLASLNPDDRFPKPVLVAWHERLVIGCAVAAAIAIASCVLLVLRERAGEGVVRGRTVLLLVVLGALELVVFAAANRGGTWSNTENLRRPNLADAYALAGTDRAIFERKLSDLAMAVHGYDLWGYDPVVLLRYAEFMAFTQQREVADLNNIGGRQPDAFHPLFSMLRGRFLVRRSGEVEEHPGAFPRFYIARDFEVVPDRADVLPRLVAPDFDPRRSLVLESMPSPLPDRNASGGLIRLLDESADHVSLSIQLETPGVLVITDAFAEGWRAVPLAGSAQREYDVMPGNAVLRAIPLAAGDHAIRVEYAPLGYRVGGWISASAALVCFIALAIWLVQRRRRLAT